MCGRYFRRSDKQQIAEAFHLGLPTTFEILPTYNAAPQTFQPVVCLNRETGERELLQMRWGLVPFWAKDAKVAYSTINAKAETVQSSAVFKEPFRQRRCLIPVDGFYEWQAISARIKLPFAIGLKDTSLFALAGLWDVWKEKAGGVTLLSFTVITTDPNPLMEPFHNRMPVILAPSDYDRWLDVDNPQQPPVDLMRPCSEDKMLAWRVAPAVGNVRNDEPGLIDPIDTPPDDQQALLFS